MNFFKRIEQWIRKTFGRKLQETLAQELKRNLTRIDEAIVGAVAKYVLSVGGESLAAFALAAIEGLGLSHAASDFLKGHIDKLEAGASRSAGSHLATSTLNAKLIAAQFMRAVRTEAEKA